MSRSYRKPYSAVTGVRSAADDKRTARRCWRRAQNYAIRTFHSDDWDELVLPARYEASYNDVWGWGRDGKQRLRTEPIFEDCMHWFYCHYFSDKDAMEYALDSFEKQKRYFARLKRK